MKQVLRDCWKELVRQLFSAKVSSRLIYTRNARLNMLEYRLTERQLAEVFTRGKLVKKGVIAKDGMRVRAREYNGYHIGLFYTFDKVRAAYVIVSCWKSKSRK